MADAQDDSGAALGGADIDEDALYEVVDQADLEAILAASREEGDALDARLRAQTEQEVNQAIQASLREAELLKKAREDRDLQEAIALSANCSPPEPTMTDDEDAIQRAIRESENEAKAAEARRLEVMRAEDEGELFQAALRASRVDLGPRGISQAAKIMATGDTTLGQALVVAQTDSHKGAGSTFRRVPSGSALPGLGGAGSGEVAESEDKARPASRTSTSVGDRDKARKDSRSGSLRGAGLAVAGTVGQRQSSPAPKQNASVTPSSTGQRQTGSPAPKLNASPAPKINASVDPSSTGHRQTGNPVAKTGASVAGTGSKEVSQEGALRGSSRNNSAPAKARPPPPPK